MWIVMTSAAKMPNSCWGSYRRVALVNVRYDRAWTRSRSDYGSAAPYFHIGDGDLPRMLSDRARGIVVPHGMRNGLIPLGYHHVGDTKRCAYARAIVDACVRAQRLNNLAPEAVPSEIMTWGGSA